MNNRNNSTRTWGFSLILIGVLFVLVGWAGSRWAEKKDRELIGENRRIESNQKRALRDKYDDILRSGLNGIGMISFRTGEVTATGPLFIFPGSVDSLFQKSAEDVFEDLKELFPERRHFVRARFHAGSADNMGPLAQWVAASPGLTYDILQNDDKFNIRGGYMARIAPLRFLTPDAATPEALGGAAWIRTGRDGTIIRRYFPESLLTATYLDVAGNELESVIGLTGSATLQFFTDEVEVARTFLFTLSVILQRLSQLGLLLLIVTPPVWVYLDARSRRLPAPLWGLFALLTSVLGALIYTLVTREAGPSCPECGEKISARFVVCPYCQTELKGTCSTCGQTVGLNWNYCPSCSTEL